MNETKAIVDQTEGVEAIDGQLELPGMPEPIQVALTIEQITDQILDALGLTELTMYQVAKALNLVLESIDATKDGDAYRVRPQMVYNYNRNKMIAKGVVLQSATAAQARAFIIKFASKFAK